MNKAQINVSESGATIVFPDGSSREYKPRKGATHAAVALLASYYDHDLPEGYRCDGTCAGGYESPKCNHEPRWSVIQESKREDLARKAFDKAVWQGRISRGHVIEIPEQVQKEGAR